MQPERLVQRVNLYLALGGSFETRPPSAAAAGEPGVAASIDVADAPASTARN